jgi:hypothetical protein
MMTNQVLKRQNRQRQILLQKSSKQFFNNKFQSMKNQILVLIVAIGLFSCQKLDAPRELPGDASKVELPTDPELFNAEMDRMAAQMRKGGNGNGHNPNNPPPPQPPPTTQKQGYLLLDFDGEDVTGTLWSTATISCANSGLSSTQIQDAITRAKSYLSQFNVEVGTSETVYNTYPQNKRRRCVITTTNFYGNVGGVAYINSFNWFDNSPCFVFSGLLQYNSKYVADAIAHELGHTLGCWHHAELRNDEAGICYVYSSYLWSFHIMGASYYDANPIFTTGFRGCNDETKDIELITKSINQ